MYEDAISCNAFENNGNISIQKYRSVLVKLVLLKKPKQSLKLNN